MLYFAAIVRTKINRERYGLTGMEFFADGLMAFAIALAGMVRIVQILLENQNSTVSRIFCVVVPYNAILAWLVDFPKLLLQVYLNFNDKITSKP
ncbi:Uncharacterized protein BM_BM17763 [Brugia malayi]|uniref:Uncharacterized protein n=1 Tax=Brugia malayi TaxID=6279 RepID=A0A4E9FN52_BRUMA|nr:Uncharacterized protein BM_BM17763 [Brugia malayi]VIO98412.1 Uncharacterized protein BM_BM17763 [Brugia malayi]